MTASSSLVRARESGFGWRWRFLRWLEGWRASSRIRSSQWPEYFRVPSVAHQIRTGSLLLPEHATDAFSSATIQKPVPDSAHSQSIAPGVQLP